MTASCLLGFSFQPRLRLFCLQPFFTTTPSSSKVRHKLVRPSGASADHQPSTVAVGPAIMPVGRNANKLARTGDIGRYFDMVDMFLANPFSLAIVSCISIFLFGNFGLAS